MKKILSVLLLSVVVLPGVMSVTAGAKETSKSIEKATVISEYLDTKGNEITKGDVIIGRVGDEYDTKLKGVFGYKFLKLADDSAPVKGIMTEKVQIVKYIYEKK